MNTLVIVFALIAAISASTIPVRTVFSHAPIATTRYLVPAGSGLEGQYAHDYTEKLYDDGSYKPEIRAIPLAKSPFGLVPAGSGLEGEYVHDLTEKLYDDGSYKPEARAIPLSATPFGLVPAGSGLEGQYIHDYSGSYYKTGHYA